MSLLCFILFSKSARFATPLKIIQLTILNGENLVDLHHSYMKSLQALKVDPTISNDLKLDILENYLNFSLIPLFLHN
jgi:hypothetical protein